jgi:hypothetical protein
MHTHMKTGQAEPSGRNDLPNPESLYYVGPVMQELWMPAQVVGGMVIPAHRQWVVVRPGTWQVPTPAGSASPTTVEPRGTHTPF